MLKRHNRIVAPNDFRQVVRRGRKQVMSFVIVYRRPSDLSRVGVIVTSKCGNAVIRNLLRRRTHAICRELVKAGNLTGDTIVRFRCEGQHPSYAELKTDILAALAA
jgi:ribonuclease P protein component